ncbi:MAG: transcription termination factor NusA [bacterium]|nr:transcription termination factor NusA [bacterium]
MFDLKAVNAALAQLEEERNIPRKKVIEAIEMALAAAYKKDYGKKGQIVRASFNEETGEVKFSQIKIVVDESRIKGEDEEVTSDEDDRVVFNPEHHIMLEDARRIKGNSSLDDEIAFSLDVQEDFGRIAAQTAKQVIIQRIREAEKTSVLEEFSTRQGSIVSGSVQRVERGNIFIDLGRTVAILPREEQISTEHFRQGERIKAYLYSVEEGPRGINLRLSRTHPQFIAKLFEVEVPELTDGAVVIESIAREPGARTKIAVSSTEESIDPVGSMVGQRGVRVSTVINELGGEKIDIIEWSEHQEEYITNALSPAKIATITLNPQTMEATVLVDDDQFSPAIGKGGQNVRLAARLTGWKIDIRSITGTEDPAPKDETV